MPRIIIFILHPLYVHFIDNDEFAQFTNLYAFVSFVNVILTFGFETAFFRYSAEKGNEQKTFYTSFWFLLGFSALFLLGTLIFLRPIASLLGYGASPEYVRWFAWIAFFDAVCVIPFAWLRFNNRPIRYSAVRVAQSLLQTVTVVALFLWVPSEVSSRLGMHEKVSYTFCSNLAGSVFGVLLLAPIIGKVRWVFDKELFRRMIGYSWPVMVAGLAFMFNENFDKFIQYYLIPKGDAGAYGGVYKLAVLMTLFVTAYRMGIEPFFFRQMNQKNARQTYARVTEYFTFFSAVVAMGIIANVSWLKGIFVPNRGYWVATDIVPIIVLANMCFGIYYNLSTWYKVTDRTFVGTLISWVGAFITIGANLLLLGKYGFMVSAWITLVTYFVMMVLSYVLGQRYYPIPYRVGKMVLVLLGLCLFSWLSYYCFEANVWVGNLLFLLFSGWIFYSEKAMIWSKIRKK